jgi:hypothetical protein
VLWVVIYCYIGGDEGQGLHMGPSEGRFWRIPQDVIYEFIFCDMDTRHGFLTMMMDTGLLY